MHRTRSNRRQATSGITLGCIMLAAAPAHADNGIQEVVVTAQKREETVQETPIAMSALAAETLAKMGITDFVGVAAASPSVYFVHYPSSANTLMLFMRGQGNGDPGQITGDGAVGVYEDGIYLSRPQGASFDLADVERVEILRGPQGTLYGRNTTGGAVNIITRKPTGEFGFKQDFTFGSRNEFRSLTTVNLPQWHDVATKFTLLKSSRDGYVKNAGSSHDYGEEKQQAGRFALRWAPAEAVTLDYALEMGDIDSTPAYYQNKSLPHVIPGYSLDRDRTWRAIDLEPGTTHFEGHALTLGWDVDDNLSFKSMTGYRRLKSTFYQDYAEALTFPFTTDDAIQNYQFSQEFQFVGSALDDSIQYALGLFYFRESGWHAETTSVGSDRYVTATSKSAAVYSQLTWTPPILDERLDLTVGGRYTKDDRSAGRSIIANGVPTETDSRNDQSFKRFNPAFTANLRLTGDISSYAKIATGYRAGGSSESGVDFSQTYGPEKVVSYELGFKSFWLEHRVRANIAVFKTDYRDIQLATSPDATQPAITQTVNAGRATINGIELDLMVMPIEDLTLSLDYAWLDANVDKVQANGQNLTRYYDIPFAPQNSYNAAIDYTFFHFDQGELAAHIGYRWQDKAYLSGTSGPAVPHGDYYGRPAYGLLDGRLTLSLDLPRGDRASIALWSRNLLDRKYIAHAIGNGDQFSGYSSQAYALGEPRSVGVNVVYEY